MLDRIARPVDPRPLAVPDAEDAIDRTAGHEIDLLRPCHRAQRQVFVHPRIERHMLFGQHLCRLPQLRVIAAQRGTSVAADITSGIETGALVVFPLDDWLAYLRLPPRDQRAALTDLIFLTQADDGKGGHRSSFRPSCGTGIGRRTLKNENLAITDNYCLF